VTQPGALPLAVVTAWYGSWAAYAIFGLTFGFTLLLFPTGRPAGGRSGSLRPAPSGVIREHRVSSNSPETPNEHHRRRLTVVC
jgi:hypothetical protein